MVAMLDALLRRRTDRVIDGTNAELSARRVAVKPRSREAVRRQAQGLTAIRLAEAQLAVPFGEAPPTNPVTSLQPTPAAQVTPYHPEPPSCLPSFRIDNI